MCEHKVKSQSNSLQGWGVFSKPQN